MTALDEIKKQINELKSQLNILAEEDNELFSENILQTSRDLDELINMYNKMVNELAKRGK